MGQEHRCTAYFCTEMKEAGKLGPNQCWFEEHLRSLLNREPIAPMNPQELRAKIEELKRDHNCQGSFSVLEQENQRKWEETGGANPLLS